MNADSDLRWIQLLSALSQVPVLLTVGVITAWAAWRLTSRRGAACAMLAAVALWYFVPAGLRNLVNLLFSSAPLGMYRPGEGWALGEVIVHCGMIVAGWAVVVICLIREPGAGRSSASDDESISSTE